MKRHPLDLVSAIFGALFTAAGLIFLISPDPWSLLFETANLSWVFPTVVLIGGAALLFSVANPRASRSRSVQTSTVTPSVEDHAGTEQQEEQSEESTK